MNYCKKHDCEFEKKCKACNREYQRKWFAANKEVQIKRVMQNAARHKQILQEVVESHLLSNPCVDCQETDMIVLDFDHVDPSQKEHSISKIITRGMSLEKLLKEIDKCVVRCANCHRRRTAQQFNTWRHKKFG